MSGPTSGRGGSQPLPTPGLAPPSITSVPQSQDDRDNDVMQDVLTNLFDLTGNLLLSRQAILE